METLPALAAGVVISYLLGAIPFGFMGGLLLSIDVRTVGSGNIGATNLARALGGGKRGAAAFIIVSLLDVSKGFVPTFFLARIAADWVGGAAPELVYFQLVFGLAAIMGHVFPVWLKFRGGKAVNTSLGVALALAWLPALIAVAAWIVVFAVWRYVSLGSVTAAVVFPLALLLLPGYAWSDNKPLFIFCLVVSVLIIIRHISNIRRLLAGTEKRIGKQKNS